jgi:hypothetical protein
MKIDISWKKNHEKRPKNVIDPNENTIISVLFRYCNESRQIPPSLSFLLRSNKVCTYLPYNLYLYGTRVAKV